MPEGNMGPETDQAPESQKFKPSWLVSSEEEFKELRGGQLGTVGKKIAMLHQTGIANTLNTNQLSDRAAKWGEEAVEEGDEVWPKLVTFFTRMADKIQEKGKEESEVSTKTGTPSEVKIVEHTLRPDEETPEGWARTILTQLDLAEKISETGMLKSFEDKEVWNLINRSVDKIPEKLGQKFIPTDPAERRYFEAKYPQGLYLKERLKIYFEARRHINDRYLQVVKATGSLEKLGLGAENVPEAFSYTPHPVSNEDMWAIYHGDQIFPELPDLFKKELAPNVCEASERWLQVGIANRVLPPELLSDQEREVLNLIFRNKDKFDTFYDNEDRNKKKKRKIDIQKFWPSPYDVYKVLGKTISNEDLESYANIPTFDSSRNVSELMADLRARLIKNLDSRKAEELGWRMFTIWLTFPLLDRNRTGVQGNSEDRDLMWSERKRVFELGEKEREPGLDYTIGRYWVSSPDQGSTIKDEDANKSAKLAHRKLTLEINAERGVLIEKDGYFEGEVMSDFLHNSMIFARDELTPGKVIRRNMASYVINADSSVRKDGFRNIPYLQMGDLAYAGYFGYTLAKAKQINNDLTKISWKEPKEMSIDDFWNAKRDLIERMEHISPWFITREFKARGKVIRERLLQDRRFDPKEVVKISGYSDAKDLEVISDPTLRNEAYRIIFDGRERISEDAKKLADDYWQNQSAKIRMIHALGQVWTGSLDSIEETAKIISQSSFSPDLIWDIITVLSTSRYLEGEYLEQFKYEVWKEMGFGTRWVLGKRKRYRNEIKAEWWE